MNGLMMDVPLTLDRILRRARDVFPEQEIVSRLADGSTHRYSYSEFYKRVLRLMNVLRDLGVKPGDRVATFAFNSYRHMELYFAIPALGAVLHTLNIKLFPEQLTYIVNHAEDQFIFVDKSLVKPLAALQDKFDGVKNFVVMDDKAPDSDVSLPRTLDYETLMSAAAETEDFPTLEENQAAGLCYTSGTTGDPKGVLYSHRSIFLHSMAVCMTDGLAMGVADVILPVVPMFHVNSWGIPFACCMIGTKPIFPGMHMLGKPLAEMIENEKVTIAAGVPTIWNILYQYLKKNKHDVSSVKTMVVGGSAAPRGLIEGFEKDFGISILHAWGMTEMSPIGTVCHLKGGMKDWDDEKRYDQMAKQGIPASLVEIRVVDDEGKDQPWDGVSFGELLVRGPWVAASYFKNDSEDAKAAFTDDGWFRTGDVVTMGKDGYMQITDRKKDLIKTRGEWLSSVEMENAVMGMAEVLEAAVIGRVDDVRGEAPVIFCVAAEGQSIDKQNVIKHLSDKFAKWQIPKAADINVIESIPKTSVGKFDKKVLRKQAPVGA